MLLLLIIIFIAFIMLGLPNSALGSAWPVMYESFNVNLASAGIISLILSGSTVLASLYCDRAVIKFGFAKVTLWSLIAMTLSSLGFSIATNFIVLCVLAVPMGLGMGLIDASLNNAVALHFKARHMNWLHGFWGVGAFLSPIIMAYFLTSHSSWQFAYRFIGFVTLVFVAIFILTIRVWKFAPHIKETGENSTALNMPKLELLKISGVKQSLLIFFAYCAIEATVGLWATSYFVQIRNIAEDTAALWLSLYFFGIMSGRFLAGFISNYLSNIQLIKLGTSLIGIGILFFILPLPTTFLLPGLFLIGLGCAPIFPSLVHETPKKFGAIYSQSIIGLQMAFAYLGSMLMPPLFGILALFSSNSLFPLFLTIFLIIMALMIIALTSKKDADN